MSKATENNVESAVRKWNRVPEMPVLAQRLWFYVHVKATTVMVVIERWSIE